MFFSKPFTFENIPDLTAKVAIVTGANTGIGYVTARELARKNAHVFVAARNKEKGTAAVEKIKFETGNRSVEFLQLDMNRLKLVKKAAGTFLDKKLPLHILVNNAGIIYDGPFTLNGDGNEEIFGTNHFGPFLFTKLLLPTIEASAPARIVNVSSKAHEFVSSGIDFNKINDPNELSPFIRYGQTKVANILFTLELNRRLEGKAVYCNSVHPGTVNTSIGYEVIEEFSKWLAPLIHFFYSPFFMLTPEDGSLNQLYAATSLEIEQKNIRAKYFVPYVKEIKPTGQANDKEFAKKLWEYTEKIIEEKLKF